MLYLDNILYFQTHLTKHTGTLGSLVSFGINFNASALQVPVSVYVVFIILMASGFFVSFFTIVPPSRVRRPDGTALAHYPHEGFWHELKAQGTLFKDWRLLVMFVPLIASEVIVIVFSSLNCELAIPTLTRLSERELIYALTQPYISTSGPAL